MSLVFLYDQRPQGGFLAQLAGATLPGAAVVQAGDETVVETTVDGFRVRVRFVLEKTRRDGNKPFTYVELCWDPGAPMYLGGVHWGYSDSERAVAFAHPGAAHRRWVGAPAALVYRLVVGPLGGRIAAIDASRHGEVMELSVGAPALKRSPNTGFVLLCRGWPADAATLTFLVDGVVELAQAVQAALPPGVTSFASTPEVVAHLAARAESRERGLKVVAAVMAGLSLVSVLLFVLVFSIVSSR